MAHRGSKPRRDLIEASYAPSTLRKYRDAVSHFLSWASHNGEDPIDPDDFDDTLCDYFHFLYDTDQGKGKAHATLYGILMTMPRLDGHLRLAARCLRGWAKLHPAKAYPPLTWELTCLIALRLCLSGRLRHAIGVLLSFDCLLRVGELVNLRREDVADAKDARIGVASKDMTLRLRSTKTGPNQWVIVRDPSVKILLRKLLASTSPGDFLFPFSATTYRNHFKAACATLGLSSAYVPHSLRHGGATRAHLLGMPLEDILIRGRWASSKSARRYIQAGRALLLTMDVPVSVQALAGSVSGDLLLFLTLAQSHTVRGG
jgi:integrase